MQSPSNQKNWIDIGSLKKDLSDFFDEQRKEFSLFGSTVNQTFEAFVFASVASWYKEHGWDVSFVHPISTQSKKHLKLKFSTRGRPSNYSYVKCRKGDEVLQIRHQLRVATKSHRDINLSPANIVLDVAIIKDSDLSLMSTDDHVENDMLISFGEAKHMSAFAELVASFIGIVYELQPDRLKRRRLKSGKARKPYTSDHPAPFLFVSGFLLNTASGIKETITQRGFDIDIYWRTNQLSKSIEVQGVNSKPAIEN